MLYAVGWAIAAARAEANNQSMLLGSHGRERAGAQSESYVQYMQRGTASILNIQCTLLHLRSAFLSTVSIDADAAPSPKT